VPVSDITVCFFQNGQQSIAAEKLSCMYFSFTCSYLEMMWLIEHVSLLLTLSKQHFLFLFCFCWVMWSGV